MEAKTVKCDWCIRGTSIPGKVCPTCGYVPPVEMIEPAPLFEPAEGGTDKAAHARGLTFSQALDAAKDGMKVARGVWDGSRYPLQQVHVMSGAIIPASQVNSRTRDVIGGSGDLDLRAYFVVFNTINGHWQPGWLPSTQDLFADDWMVIQ